MFITFGMCVCAHMSPMVVRSDFYLQIILTGRGRLRYSFRETVTVKFWFCLGLVIKM